MTNTKWHSSRWLVWTAALALVSGPALAAVTPEQNDNTGAFGHFLAGRFAAQTHDLGFAADELEAVTQDETDIGLLNGQAFLAALLAGRPYAVELAQRLPSNPLAQLVTSNRAVKARDWSSAATQYGALVGQDALMQVLRPILLAWAEFGGGNTDDALAGLAPLTTASQFAGVFALHAALIADLAGRQDTAAQYYKTASDRFGNSNLRFAVILASWQARRGDLPGAQRTIADLSGTSELALVSEGLRADVSKPAVASAQEGIAEAYLAVAATVREQNSGLAEAIARLSLDMKPELTPARLLLAEILASGDRAPEALRLLQPVAASDALAPLVALRRAAYMDMAGEDDAAGTLLQQLAREHPDRSEPPAQLGDLFRKEKKFAEAATAYSDAISKLGTPNRADWRLFYARGVSYERSGAWPKAEDDFQYALRLSPDQPGVLNYLAYSWAERGEHLDEAQTMLQNAIAARPNEGAFIDSLGWVMLREGKVEDAIAQLQRAAELDPEDPVVNFHLGDALQAAGRLREAEYQWRRALILQPEADDAKKLNERLATLAKDPADQSPAAPQPTH